MWLMDVQIMGAQEAQRKANISEERFHAVGDNADNLSALS